MGADMILSTVSFYGTKTDDERKKILLNKITKLTMQDLNRDDYANILEAWEDRGMLEEEHALKEYKEFLRDLITAFFTMLHYRDVTVLHMGGFKMYATGGNSWGDSPTESYDTFYMMELLPESLLSLGEIGWPPSTFDQFLKEYDEQLPIDLKKRLQ